MIRVLALCLLPLTAHAGVFPYTVTTTTLPNGVTLHVVPMKTPGVVAFGTWMSVGSRDEVDAGRTGFAHFFEHLMFLGTPTLSADERETRMLRMAGDDNAWTWLDETVYHTVLPAHALPELIKMEGDRFQNLTLTPEDVQREAGAVYGEFRKSESNPGFRLREAVWGTAFEQHTYHHTTIGYEADIAEMPTAWAYATEFMQRHYRPEKATVLAVGDVDPEEVRGWVEASYGSWSVPEVPDPPIAVEPAQTEQRRVHVPWPSATSPRLVMAWKIPESNPDLPEVAALELLDGLLLSDTGPLYKRLVIDEQLAYNVWGGRGDHVDPSLFSVSVLLRPESSLEAVEAIVLEEVEAMKVSVDTGALDRVREHARNAFLSSLDNPMSVFDALGWSLRRGGDATAIDRFQTHFSAATGEDVSAAATRFLVPEGLTVGTLAAEVSP